MSNNTLRVYKNLLLLAKRLPDRSKRFTVRQQIRDAFRAHREAGTSEADELIREAEAKISYLRIVTPKSNLSGGVRSREQDAASEKHYIYTGKDGGSRVEGPGVGGSKTPISQRDYSDARAQATRSIRRQHFMDRGINPFGGS